MDGWSDLRAIPPDMSMGQCGLGMKGAEEETEQEKKRRGRDALLSIHTC